MIRILVDSIQLTTVTEERTSSFGEIEEVEHRHVALAGSCGPVGMEESFTIELPRDDLEDLLDALLWDDATQSHLAALLRDVLQDELSTCLQRLARD